MDVDVGDAGCLQDEEFPAKFVIKLHLNVDAFIFMIFLLKVRLASTANSCHQTKR